MMRASALDLTVQRGRGRPRRRRLDVEEAVLYARPVRAKVRLKVLVCPSV